MEVDEKILELIETKRNKEEAVVKGSTSVNLIDSILSGAMKKLELFLGLPLLLQDETEPLKLLVKGKETEKFLNCVDKIQKGEAGGVEKEDSDEALIFYTYNDANLEVLFNTYSANPNLGPSDEEREFYSLLNKVFCKPKVATICDKVKDRIPSNGKFAIDVIGQLRNVIVKKMKKTWLEETQQARELTDMVQYSDWAKDELAVLSRKFTLTMNKQAQKIGDKCKEAKNVEERTNAVIAHSKEMVDFLTKNAEKKMTWERKKSEYVQESLGVEAKKLETEYETFFNQNLLKEKNLRVKRYKTEAQLITILKKYDVDVRERDKSYRELLAIFNEEQKQLNEIKEQFEAQAVDYNALMDEKDEYERTMWEEKLYSIQKRMAARRIQRFYRLYVSLCVSNGVVRFKKKKGKKKKK